MGWDKMRVFIVVHGFVQGVGYRSLVKRAAERCGLKGMVKNSYDGSVHILAEGASSDIELFKNLINVDMSGGPQVRHIDEFTEGSGGFPVVTKHYDNFLIEH